MKSMLLCLFILFITSCKEKQNKTTPPQPATQAKDSVYFRKDSLTLPKDSTSPQISQEKIIYIECARLDLKNYSIAVKSRFNVPLKLEEDSSYYFDRNFLFVYNKKKRTMDTVMLQIDHLSPSDLVMEDLSDSLHFKTLVLQISWRGDSDMPTYEFVEYDGHSLKDLFLLYDLVSLRRKDKWTLSGFVGGRDELVYSEEDDYPLTVSLKDHEVKITDPAVQYIGYPSRAHADIKVYRDPTQNKTSAYTIKKGTEIMIDTLYRSRNLVRLIVSDSIILYARPDKIKDKIAQDTAG